MLFKSDQCEFEFELKVQFCFWPQRGAVALCVVPLLLYELSSFYHLCLIQ